MTKQEVKENIKDLLYTIKNGKEDEIGFILNSAMKMFSFSEEDIKEKFKIRSKNLNIKLWIEGKRRPPPRLARYIYLQLRRMVEKELEFLKIETNYDKTRRIRRFY